jgi:hypothetical protein
MSINQNMNVDKKTLETRESNEILQRRQNPQK